MKKLLLFLLFISSITAFSLKRPETNNLIQIEKVPVLSDSCYWKGKFISCKAVDDSLRIRFFKFCDSLNKSEKTPKKSK